MGDSNNSNSNLSADLDKVTDIPTLDGYARLLEKHGNGSNVFFCQAPLYANYRINDWYKKLESESTLYLVDFLFELPNKLCRDEKSMKREECITLIQFFSLLENVFRNVLLRPYIPAYRTINKDSGVYRCFIESYQDRMPFDKLKFKSTDPNLLTYTETDQSKTILYALTCNVLCHYFIGRLERF